MQLEQNLKFSFFDMYLVLFNFLFLIIFYFVLQWGRVLMTMFYTL